MFCGEQAKEEKENSLFLSFIVWFSRKIRKFNQVEILSLSLSPLIWWHCSSQRKISNFHRSLPIEIQEPLSEIRKHLKTRYVFFVINGSSQLLSHQLISQINENHWISNSGIIDSHRHQQWVNSPRWMFVCSPKHFFSHWLFSCWWRRSEIPEFFSLCVWLIDHQIFSVFLLRFCPFVIVLNLIILN
jgi:hypothetical protein